MAGLDIATLAKAVQGQMTGAAKGFGLDPTVAGAFGSQLAAGGQQQATAGNIFNAGVEAENAKKAAADALRAKMRLEQDKADPSKYKVVRKQDGGFDFFDPEGNQIDIATYAAKTNQRAADIIKDSDNPIDIQYAQDHALLNEYISALKSKDTETLEKIRIANPALNKFDDEGGIDRLINSFKQNYRRYYTPRTQDPNAWGQRPGNAVFNYADPYASTGSIGG